MYRILSCVVLFCAISVQCQNNKNINWRTTACLVGHNAYYSKVMQETFTIIEKDIKWCNMKMINRGREVNEQLFKWHARGTVNYTDGFVVSLEKIELSNIRGQAGTNTVNGVQENVLLVQGRVNLRGLKIGHNVIVSLEDSGVHRFTGEYSHEQVMFDTSITWNLRRKELSTKASVWSTTSNGSTNYRPASNITEMISREKGTARGNEASFQRWSRDVIAPHMLKVAKTLEFPTVRFDNRC